MQVLMFSQQQIDDHTTSVHSKKLHRLVA